MQMENRWQAAFAWHYNRLFLFLPHTTQFAARPDPPSTRDSTHSLLVGISELTQTPSEASIAKLIGRKKLKMKI